jgi:hypothetical protein
LTVRSLLRPLLLVFWVLPATVATLGLRLVPSRLNPDLTLIEIFASQVLIWFPWAIWAHLIVAVAERAPLERGGIWKAIGAHALLAFGMNEPRGFESMWVIGIRQYGDLLMVVYWAVVGAHAGIRWHGRYQEEALTASRLREDVAQAHLQALRAQLNPHFLFNAMNAVVTLIGRDAAQAREMLVRIADLLRATLTAGDAQETTLARELELTARYLEIEQVRFADRLTVQWRVDPGLGEWRVPAFALQPLVENALRHGLSQRRAPGAVEISAREADGTLELRVGNDGPDGPIERGAAPQNGAGIALKNLRARLERLYGADAALELAPRAAGGMDAIVRIPRGV